MRTAGFGLLLAFSLASDCRAAGTQILEFKGDVNVERGGARLSLAGKALPFGLESGDQVATGHRSRVLILFEDGAKMQLSKDTVVTIAPPSKTRVVHLAVGRLKAWVYGSLKGHFAVATPTAVAAVRGTEFDVGYDESKEMLVEVYDGLIAVQDLLGHEQLVASGERLRVLPDRPLERPERIEGRLAPDPRTEIRREVALGLSKDQVQTAAAHEARLAEYQEGKVAIDVFGQRVRLEEYIIRPAPNQFKFVDLTERTGSVNYYYYLGTFNTTLPPDLRQALSEINGATGTTAPAYFLTAYETGRSNSTDIIQENATGGHLVQSTLTQSESLYNPTNNTFQTIPAGTPLWQTLFDYYQYKVNGTEYFGWMPLSGSGITSYDYTQWITYIAGATLGTANASIICANNAACVAIENELRQATITTPNGPDSLYQNVTINYSNVVGGPIVYSETYGLYVADNMGNIATTADFSGVLSGQSYLQTLLQFNYEEVITSSVFSGRKIDLVIDPKILIEAGALQ